jgi:hypothetical protein
VNDFFDFAARHGLALVRLDRHKKFSTDQGWQAGFSKDRADWEKWIAEGFNVGVHAGASRLITFDLDSKHGGIEAVRQRFDAWCIGNGMAPIPHHVKTASSGQHVYMQVADGVSMSTLASNLSGKIGAGIDVLVGNRQSVAPGSYFDGTPEGKPSGTYSFNDAPLYEAPPSVLKFCTPEPRIKSTPSEPSGYDQADAGKMVQYLTEHDEFASYDEWLRCGMALRAEFGNDGLALWALTHNATVTPDVIATKWDSFDSDAKAGAVTIKSLMKRAHELGWKGSVRQSIATMFGGKCAEQAALDLAKATGAASPSIVPDQVQQLIRADWPVPGGPTVAPLEPAEPAGGLMQKLGDRLKDFVLPDYLWDGILLKRFCYSMTAQTGTGKTAIALLIAAHVATGQSLCGLEIEKGQVIYMAGENPIDVDMRFLGLCKVMGLDPDALEIAIIPFAGPLSKYADTIRSECETRNVKPALVIVDTAAAYFDGKEGNSNEEQGDYARSLRALTTLPGEPCIVVLAHPTKGAKMIDEMVPRGGGAFLAEMDGNIGVARGDGGLIGAQAIGKFRGPEFTPLHFALHGIRDVPALYDAKKGKFRPTVVAQPVSEAGAAAVGMESETADIRLLRDIDTHPRDTHRDRAPRLGCSHTTVGRRIEKLAGRKLVDDSGLIARLTAKGQRELNDLEAVHQAAPSNVQFPVPAKG